MASVWLSKKKPRFSEYLKPFVEECKVLATEGLNYLRDGVCRNQKILALDCIADSVARPLLRNSNQFNGKLVEKECTYSNIFQANLIFRQALS
jgi:hypothetical protein